MILFITQAVKKTEVMVKVKTKKVKTSWIGKIEFNGANLETKLEIDP